MRIVIYNFTIINYDILWIKIKCTPISITVWWICIIIKNCTVFNWYFLAINIKCTFMNIFIWWIYIVIWNNTILKCFFSAFNENWASKWIITISSRGWIVYELTCNEWWSSRFNVNSSTSFSYIVNRWCIVYKWTRI